MESPLPGAGGIWGEYIKIQNGLLNSCPWATTYRILSSISNTQCNDQGFKIQNGSLNLPVGNTIFSSPPNPIRNVTSKVFSASNSKLTSTTFRPKLLYTHHHRHQNVNSLSLPAATSILQQVQICIDSRQGSARGVPSPSGGVQRGVGPPLQKKEPTDP